jgi:hypothetical protein
LECANTKIVIATLELLNTYVEHKSNERAMQSVNLFGLHLFFFLFFFFFFATLVRNKL